MNERPIEYGYALTQIAARGPVTLLDVGCGKSAFPAVASACGIDVTATDPAAGYWRGRRYENRHCAVVRDDICETALSGPYDMVTCLSTLEHIEAADTAVASMLALLAPGGALVLTFPWAVAHVPDAYALPDAGYTSGGRYICAAFCAADLARWCKGGAVVVDIAQWRVFTGGMWTVGERLSVPERVEEGGDLACVTLTVS